jgi:hypothetical protein
VEDLKFFDYPEVNDVKIYYPHGFHKTDRLGRPIYIERIGALNIKRLWATTTAERMELYKIREYEKMVSIRMPASS